MTGIVAHTYPEWWLKLTGQAAHWSTDYSHIFEQPFTILRRLLPVWRWYTRESLKLIFQITFQSHT